MINQSELPTFWNRLHGAWCNIETGPEVAEAIGNILDHRDIVAVKAGLIAAIECLTSKPYNDFIDSIRDAESRADIADLLAQLVIVDSQANKEWLGAEWHDLILLEFSTITRKRYQP